VPDPSSQARHGGVADMTGTDSTDGDLLYEVREGVGYVTLFHPA
jgi:hypothetical protein